MNRNKKDLFYKEYLKLIRRRHELQDLRIKNGQFEPDRVIEKEIAEIDGLLETKFYKLYRYFPNSIGFYKTIKNRKDRAYNKSALRRNLKYEDYDRYEYRYSHRHSAKWEAW